MRERSKNTKKQTKRIPENKDDMEQTKKYKIKTKRKNTPCETAFFRRAVLKNTWNRAVCPARVRTKKRPSSRC